MRCLKQCLCKTFILDSIKIATHNNNGKMNVDNKIKNEKKNITKKLH